LVEIEECAVQAELVEVAAGTRFDIGLQGYLAVLTAREKLADRAALVAEDPLAMATINGAKAVGLANRIGSLEPGKRADVVVRANDVPEAYPLTDPVSQLVYKRVLEHRSYRGHRWAGRPRGPPPDAPRVQDVFDDVQASVKRVFDRMGYRYERRIRD
jgi:hypothetical protein